MPPSRGGIMKNSDVNIMECLSGGPKHDELAVDAEGIGGALISK